MAPAHPVGKRGTIYHIQSWTGELVAGNGTLRLQMSAGMVELALGFAAGLG